jgi:asparagine synthase (glutamine-hydrolysing)
VRNSRIYFKKQRCADGGALRAARQNVQKHRLSRTGRAGNDRRKPRRARNAAAFDYRSGGRQQPIYNRDKTKFIVFNGEIYNYRELKKDLEKRGHRFKTNSDTETILLAYEEFGAECVQNCAECLPLRFGTKPKKVFSSRETESAKTAFLQFDRTREFRFRLGIKKVLLEHGEIEREIDYAALDAYLTFGLRAGRILYFQKREKLSPVRF